MADGQLKVSLLTFDFGESIVPLAQGLSRHASVQLLLPDQELPPFATALDPTIDVHTFTKPRLRQPWRQLAMVADLLRSIRRFDPDVVHLQQGHLWFNLGLPVLRSRPVAVTVHDAHAHPGDRGGRKTPQVVMNLAQRRADQLIAHAEHVRSVLITERGRDGADVHVVPLAFGDGPVSPDPGEPPRVLFFGRIWPYKGLEHLVRAQPTITARVPEARIVIAGAGEPFERYRALMSDPAAFDVELGHIPVERREELFRQASLVVLPYVEASQTGVVPLAYRHGKPVVATTVGGLPEVVHDGRTGVLVPPADPEALGRAIADLLVNPDRRRTMAVAARRAFEQDYDLDSIVEKTLTVYGLARARGTARS